MFSKTQGFRLLPIFTIPWKQIAVCCPFADKVFPPQVLQLMPSPGARARLQEFVINRSDFLASQWTILPAAYNQQKFERDTHVAMLHERKVTVASFPPIDQPNTAKEKRDLVLLRLKCMNPYALLLEVSWFHWASGKQAGFNHHL